MGLHLRMQVRYQWVFLHLLFCTYNVAAQVPADSADQSIWKLNAYAESFYSLDPRMRNGEKHSEFQFNHNRANRPNLNQVSVGVEHLTKTFRFNVSLHAGTYVVDNYAAEAKSLQAINRAYVGFRINKRKNCWLDVGVFPSYIGFEGVNAFDNSTVTRSLLAENSPYFLAGIRANYPINSSNELNVFVLTGWQRIRPVKGSSIPSLGWQWMHTFQNQSKFNWSVWAGTDQPDSSRKWRYFNNLYWQGKKGRWSYTAGIDIGLEQKQIKSRGFFSWYSPVLITQYLITNQWKTAFRIEQYQDPDRIITKPTNGSAVRINSQSINIDYSPVSSILCRAEWRALQAKEPVFLRDNEYTDRTAYTTLSVSYQLNAARMKKIRIK